MSKARQIIKTAGGYMQVAILCGVSEGATKRWARLGVIPEEYWPKFLKHPACRGLLTAIDLHLANEKSRRGRS